MNRFRDWTSHRRHRPLVIAAGACAALLVAGLSVTSGCATSDAGSGSVTYPPLGHGADHDSWTSIRHVIRLQPTGQPGKYHLLVQRELRYRVRARRDLMPTFFIYESPLARLQNLRAFLGGRPLAGRHIKRETVEKRHVFIDDARVYQIHFPVSRLGTSIRYHYQLRYKDPALLAPAVIPGVHHLKRFELVVHHPPGSRIDFRTWRPYARPGAVVYRSSDVSRWVLSNVRRRRPLPYYSFNGLEGLVWPVLHTAKGPLQPITPAGHARWYRALFRNEPPLQAHHRKLVRRLVAGATTPLAKVRALHEFVRRRVRYIAVEKGMGRLVPTPTDEVLTRRWGDCKDMSNLLHVMGREAGVQIDMTLVGVRERPTFGKAIHTMQYDHMIASYKHGGRRIFFDPTAYYVPFGQVPEAVIGKQALVVAGKASEALRIPAPPQQPTLEMEITAAAGRLYQAGVRIVVRNRLRHLLTKVRRDYLGEARQTRLRRLLESPVQGLVIRRLRLVSLKPDSAVLLGQADLTGFVVRSPSALYLPRAPFDPYSELLSIRAKDSLPLMFSGRPHFRLTLSLSAFGHRPRANQTLDIGARGVARFQSRLKTTKGGVVLTYHLRQWKKLMTGDARDQMLHFHSRYQAAQARWHRLERTVP